MTRPGLYWWVRDKDDTGMSGVGRVAQVAVFEDGVSVLRWLSSRNAAGVASTVIYETVEQLVHVHGHGEGKTGHLEPAFRVGDVLFWNCIEGFGGVAHVAEERESTESNYKVKILDRRMCEHDYQPAAWAHNFELSGDLQEAA